MRNYVVKVTHAYVPKHDETPSEDMIAWLNENPLDWEGDEFGITLFLTKSSSDLHITETAEPGDIIVRFEMQDGTLHYRATSPEHLYTTLANGPQPLPNEVLQQQLNDWAFDTFGEGSLLRIAIRGNKEMGELVSALAHDKDADFVAEECADVAFFLAQICERLDRSLMGELAKKFEKNKKRTWERGKDGAFQHVKTPNPVPVHAVGDSSAQWVDE